jgi:hypothetical protein
MARTAVIAGTATTVSNRVSRRQANRWAEQDQGSPAYMASTAPPQQQYAPPPQQYAPPAPEAPQPDRLDQLKELAALKEQGVLSEEEFAAEKARILGS